MFGIPDKKAYSVIINSEKSFPDINDKNTGEIMSICSINQNVGSNSNNMMINENLKENNQKYVANRAIRKSMNKNSKFNQGKVPSQIFPKRNSMSGITEIKSVTPKNEPKPNIFSDPSDAEHNHITGRIRANSGKESNETNCNTLDPTPDSPTFQNP